MFPPNPIFRHFEQNSVNCNLPSPSGSKTRRQARTMLPQRWFKNMTNFRNMQAASARSLSFRSAIFLPISNGLARAVVEANKLQLVDGEDPRRVEIQTFVEALQVLVPIQLFSASRSKLLERDAARPTLIKDILPDILEGGVAFLDVAAETVQQLEALGVHNRQGHVADAVSVKRPPQGLDAPSETNELALAAKLIEAEFSVAILVQTQAPSSHQVPIVACQESVEFRPHPLAAFLIFFSANRFLRLRAAHRLDLATLQACEDEFIERHILLAADVQQMEELLCLGVAPAEVPKGSDEVVAQATPAPVRVKVLLPNVLERYATAVEELLELVQQPSAVWIKCLEFTKTCPMVRTSSQRVPELAVIPKKANGTATTDDVLEAQTPHTACIQGHSPSRKERPCEPRPRDQSKFA
mmetsp:Transcript_24589/g.68471  ORF Transcript_24589/g.68471 Transcript_24589/m.68471 type:complete len:412 (+) Transcript_24589:1116-2351(+)